MTSRDLVIPARFLAGAGLAGGGTAEGKLVKLRFQSYDFHKANETQIS